MMFNADQFPHREGDEERGTKKRRRVDVQVKVQFDSVLLWYEHYFSIIILLYIRVVDLFCYT